MLSIYRQQQPLLQYLEGSTSNHDSTETKF